MEGGSALMGFLFALTLFYPCSGQEGIVVSKFSKTTVIIENVDVRNDPTFTDAIKRNQECSQLCTGDYGCRKYMVTTDITTHERLCYRYSDGENCVASESEVSNKETVCYRKLQQSNGTHCVSPVGYYGPNCENIITDCSEGKTINNIILSLSYVKPAGNIFEVFCDNGMTNIQVRRSDSVEVNFTRPLIDYVNGFGNTHSEYWLGLENIYALTNRNGVNFDLDIRINDCTIRYPYFRLGIFNTFISNPPYEDCNTNMLGDLINNANLLTYEQSGYPACSPLQLGGWWYYTNYPYNYQPCTLTNLNNPRAILQSNSINAVWMRLNRIL